MLPETWKKEIGDSINDASNREAENRKSEIDKHNAMIAAPLHRLHDQFKSYVEQQERSEQAKSRREIATIIGLFLTAALALAQGVVLILQWRALSSTDEATHALAKASISQTNVAQGQLTAMQGQLEELKAQRLNTVAQLRANIRRERPAVHPTGEDGKLVGPGEKLAGWQVNPNWTNVGSTNAREVRTKFEIMVSDVPVGTQIGPADCPVAAFTDPPPLPTVIRPGGPFIELSKFLSLQDALRAKNERTIILVYGILEYKDVFSEEMHHADWCVAMIPNDIPRSVFSFLIMREIAD
jgi:hypothetical protein